MAKFKVNKKFLGADVGTDGYPLPWVIIISEDMPKAHFEWLHKVGHPAVELIEEPKK